MNFAQPASTHEGRQTFAKSAVRIVEELGLDGIAKCLFPRVGLDLSELKLLLYRTGY